jgi:hypothetical protein
MRFPWSKKPPVPRPPIEGQVQEFIEQIEVKRGAQVLRTISFFIIAALLLVWVANTQFRGLREPEAMDMGQVARNMSEGKGFVTDVIRPYQLWYYQFHLKRNVDVEAMPELVHAPVYPWLLSKVFRVCAIFWDWDVQLGDRMVMVTSMWWILPSLALVYLLGREWFDKRVGVLAAWVYLLSVVVVMNGLSGTPLTFLTFVLLAAMYCLALATRFHLAETRRGMLSLFFLALGGLFLAVGALTRYAFIVWAIPMALYVALTFRPRVTGMAVSPETGSATRASGSARARFAGIFAVFVLALLMPLMMWSVNRLQVSGWFWGLASAQLKEGTYVFGDDQLMRRYSDDRIREKNARGIRRQVAVKTANNFVEVVQNSARLIGPQLVLACFAVAFFHPFRRQDVSRMLRCILLGLGLAAFAVAMLDGNGGGLLSVFYPLTVIFGCALFWIFFDRLNLDVRLKQLIWVGIFVVVNAVPLILVLLPPVPPPQYPPIKVRWITDDLGSWFSPQEQIVSDIPWAVAWYGRRKSVLLPWTTRELVMLKESPIFVNSLNGLYLTQRTDRDTANDTDFVDKQFGPTDLPLDVERAWVLMLYGGRPAYAGFPYNVRHSFDYRHLLWTTPVPGTRDTPRRARPFWWDERRVEPRRGGG